MSPIINLVKDRILPVSLPMNHCLIRVSQDCDNVFEQFVQSNASCRRCNLVNETLKKTYWKLLGQILTFCRISTHRANRSTAKKAAPKFRVTIQVFHSRQIKRVPARVAEMAKLNKNRLESYIHFGCFL